MQAQPVEVPKVDEKKISEPSIKKIEKKEDLKQDLSKTLSIPKQLTVIKSEEPPVSQELKF